MIVDPPLPMEVQFTVTVALPPATLVISGTAGIVKGTAGVAASVAAPVPALLVTATENRYEVPLLRPVTEQLLALVDTQETAVPFWYTT